MQCKNKEIRWEVMLKSYSDFYGLKIIISQAKSHRDSLSVENT